MTLDLGLARVIPRHLNVKAAKAASSLSLHSFPEQPQTYLATWQVTNNPSKHDPCPFESISEHLNQ